MRYVQITVLRKDYYPDLARAYGTPEACCPCPILEEGQVIRCERHYKPRELCDEAWKAVQHYVYALYHGATEPFGKGWMRDAGVAIVTCNDGLRPVTFKLEAMEE